MKRVTAGQPLWPTCLVAFSVASTFRRGKIFSMRTAAGLAIIGVLAFATACAEKTKAIALPTFTTPHYPDFVRPVVPPDLATLPAATNQERAWQFLQAGDLHNADREVAAALTRAVGRGTDLVARYGGEEFVMLLPETPVAGCRVVAERARAAVQKLAIAHARSRTGTGVVTLSAGMATIVPGEDDSPEETVRRADEALYRAKQAGRNRVEAALMRRQ